MAVFRVERNKGYTVMSNHHLRNKELSLKAKGLLSQMLSLPEDWDYTLAGLSFINREKIDAIREAVKELERAGYIVRSRERDEKGRLRDADYVIFEQPQTPPVSDLPTLENPTLDNPTLEKPTQEKPTLENPTQLNNHSQKLLSFRYNIDTNRVEARFTDGSAVANRMPNCLRTSSTRYFTVGLTRRIECHRFFMATAENHCNVFCVTNWSSE